MISPYKLPYLARFQQITNSIQFFKKREEGFNESMENTVEIIADFLVEIIVENRHVFSDVITN